MSQNKTIIQGLNDTPSTAPGYGPAAPSGHDFYQRGPSSRGTIVPGMNAPMPGNKENPIVAPQGPKGNAFTKDDPVVGFLYSVSRTGAGEYWPLHIGTNTIGRNPNCDIVLNEKTVSGQKPHAELIVRKNKNPEKIVAALTDCGAKNGTMLNGESLDIAQTISCKNGDIVTIGDNYELYVVIIDSPTLGLKPMPDFHPAIEEEEVSFDPYAGGGSAHRPTQPINDPYGSNWNNNYGANATVGYDGNSTAFNSGGTVVMP